ncbi:RES domain-containing protein [Microbacterium suaedae]|uniref:RES domain-containing protein n=1 Tax=Microbacterium suaedae TaxID=2067813 RepID=UPI000DA145D9|nr:RES domain-containing protein [Microbacterium suaedae]
MQAYRVFFFDPHAGEGDPGHASYLHRPQGASRWDNPDLYDAWYVAATPEAAVGETFGMLETWRPEMFSTDYPNMRRALATFELSDDASLFDFDNAQNLVDITMRPSDVVVRTRAATQRRAASLFEARRDDGEPRWDGVSWWSYYDPSWRVFALWATASRRAPLTLVEVEDLDIDQLAVVSAAGSIRRVRKR